MKFDKGLIAGSSTLLVLTLLESGDMYGYQMIEELSRRSNDAFQFQEGTLYPILHGLEKGKYLSGYQQQAPSGRMRKYYRLTRKGRSCWRRRRRSGPASTVAWPTCSPAEPTLWREGDERPEARRYDRRKAAGAGTADPWRRWLPCVCWRLSILCCAWSGRPAALWRKSTPAGRSGSGAAGCPGAERGIRLSWCVAAQPRD